MNVQEAKARIGDVWHLGELLGWPLCGELQDFAFWRGNSNTPALSITPDGRGWKDFATGDHGDMVAMLAKAEKLTVSEACFRLIRLAQGVVEPRAPIAPRDPAETSEEKRSRWPVITSTGVLQELPAFPGKPMIPDYVDEQIHRLAIRRGLAQFHGVEAAFRRGLLVFLDWYDGPRLVPAWGVTDGKRLAAQVRRMDGKLWRVGKSKSLPGSVGGWPIGIAEVGNRVSIVMTEGEPDLLAALTLYCMLSPDPESGLPRDPGTWGFCCLAGAGKHVAESALPLFKGKSICVVPHIDPIGARSIDTWGPQLVDAGARVSVFNLAGLLTDDGKPAKDLNDVMTARGFKEYRSQLAEIFSP